MRKLGILIIILMSLIVAVEVGAVSLTIPAAGSTLTETEYDTNNNLVETAVSQLNAVDITKHDKTKFTSYSTFDTSTFVNYTANHRTYFETYSGGVSGQLDTKHDKSTFTSYSTFDTSAFVTYTTSINSRLDDKHDKSAFTSYSTYYATISDSKLETSAFTSFSGFEVIRNATKHDKTAFTSYSTNDRATFVAYTSEVRTYIDNHQFFKYTDSHTATYFSCDSTIPLDDTVPLYTEGQRITRFTYTPTETGNELQIKCDIQLFMPTINKHVIVASFVNNTCVDVRVKDSAVANEYLSFSFEGDYTTIGTATTPIELRAGSSDGTIFYVNGNAGSRIFGGASKAHIAVTETD